ncbi:MAG TPA: glycosyltransferase family 39 protein, partial [Candidatus Woesebacteria bacterium]|nr:glycosyltransferase family 39 protein [Candidatus Woesebacteria bacterium]
FNYGSLPVYILRGVSQILEIISQKSIANYDGMLYIGRTLSLLNDIVVIIFIYKIAKLLFGKKEVALFASFFYVFAFFPIQNTHFFIVDTYLNLFGTLLIYTVLTYLKKPSLFKLFILGVIFAAAITTKVTAILFAPVIGLALLFANTGSWLQKIVPTLLQGLLLVCITLIFSFLCMPYGFIHFEQFMDEISLQLKMNSDPYIFPYTLQYVGTLPYWYYIKNIAIWGLGPFIFGFFLLGVYEHAIQFKFAVLKKWFKQHQKEISIFIIFYLFYILYFLIIGKSAVKFMRYMLIMYPFFAIIAGYGAYEGFKSLKGLQKKWIMGICFAFIMLWTLAFINIYTTKTTRIQATEWIYTYIPEGSTLAVEHWDDRIPVFDPGKYMYEELTLYDIPDNDLKWQILNE